MAKMKTLYYRAFVMLFAFALLVHTGQAMAQGRGHNERQPIAAGAVNLPISGTVLSVGNQPIGQFGGTLTVNRFAKQNNQVLAIGFVRGTIVNQSGQILKSGLQAVTLPVTNIGNGSTASIDMETIGPARLGPAVFTKSLDRQLLLVRETCGVLHLDLGGNAVNLLGANVNLSPVTLDISGDSTGPLGAPVCQVLATLGNVGEVVGLLNSILGLVTRLLGGLTGGLGG
jgi:hypothetical protein